MYSKYIFLLVLFILLSVSLLSASQLTKGNSELNEVLLEADQATMLPVIIVMKEQVDPEALYSSVKDLPKKERREVTVSTLKEFSDKTQSEIKPLILKGEKSKLVESPKFLWITNIVVLKAKPSFLVELDKREDISSILYDPMRQVMPAEDPKLNETFNNDQHEFKHFNQELSYNITQVGADKLWEEGYYGQGVVVSVLDSGVNYNHEDLKGHLWIHEDYPYHGYDFVNDDYDTMDTFWHGTHCCGTIVGDGTSGTRTGLAPMSTLMAVGVLIYGDIGQGILIQGIEFSVEHGADVLSISLGWYHKERPNRALLRDTMVNTLSAGVIASVAAGNGGDSSDMPAPANIGSPSDCPSPWRSPFLTSGGGVSAVFTSGASDIENDIASWSSKGPTTWEDVDGYKDYPLAGKTGLIKPDIASPGVDVKSLTYNNNTGYREDSGTSMAAPTTAGAIALLISKDPEITPEQITQYIEETAYRHGTANKDNERGAGILDIYAASKRIQYDKVPGKPFLSYPMDEGIEIPLEANIKWLKNCKTDSFTLYLGTDNPPSNVIDGIKLEEGIYNLYNTIEPDTQYFWRVDAHNQYGSTEGDIWSFKTVLPVTIDFETAEFAPYEWDFSTSGADAQNWSIVDDYAYEGEFSARSGEINDGSFTRMRVTAQVKEEGIISFYYKTSTESRSDILRFYIDNEMLAEWSGENDWQRFEYPVTPGIKGFSWVYAKDTMGSAGEDAVWIDNITLPPHFKPNIVYTPEELSLTLDYEQIGLDWQIEINEDANPIEFTLQGFNLFMSLNEGEFTQLNEDLIENQNFNYFYDSAADYSFYITAVYRIRGKIVETEPSNIVSVSILPAIAKPSISPEAGEYDEPIMVSFEVEEDTEVYYSIDETDPSYTSLLYDKPFELTETTIVKARAYQLGCLPSEIVLAHYEIITTDITEQVIHSGELTIDIYPNPVGISNVSRGTQNLTIELSTNSPLDKVSIDIYNIKGQLIKDFVLSNVERGHKYIQWDLRNAQGKSAPNGIYFIKLHTGSDVYHKRVMLLR
ncbi:MAG: S8 family serine peptidase [Candidatus Cloacimonas sp.]|nr:S8 family serine peptidase [Candidatus Cloacimonadota bacterium]